MAGRVFSRILKEHEMVELNPGQGRIFFTLWQEDSIPMRELAQKTGLEKSTLSRMVERMEEAGLVERLHSDGDRRMVIVRLSSSSRDMKGSYEAVSAEMATLYYRGFNEAEMDAFEGYLERIYANLSRAMDGGDIVGRE